MRWLLSLSLLSSLVFGIDHTFEIENTNIFSKTDSNQEKDYNRLRIYSFLEDERYENFLAKMIIDNENIYDLEKNNNTNKTKIYRAYLKYTDEKNLLIIGKQRVPFGVGKVWNPTDIFNPINAAAIEINQRRGTDAIRYEYALWDLSNIDTTLSKDKLALRIKGYIDVADIGLILLKDKDINTNIYGYEIQGELMDTGVEIRSEGGYFHNKDTKDLKELILGAEYSFTDSTILGEYKYNSLNDQKHFALDFSYNISPLLTFGALGIKNLKDKSSLALIRFNYSLSDESELNIGSYFYSGDITDQYGEFDNSFFLRFFIHF